MFLINFTDLNATIDNSGSLAWCFILSSSIHRYHGPGGGKLRISALYARRIRWQRLGLRLQELPNRLVLVLVAGLHGPTGAQPPSNSAGVCVMFCYCTRNEELVILWILFAIKLWTSWWNRIQLICKNIETRLW